MPVVRPYMLPPVTAVSLATLLVASLGAAHAAEPVGTNARAASATIARDLQPNVERNALQPSVAGQDCKKSARAPTTPFLFTVDGKSVSGNGTPTNGDSQRCTDVALARADVQIRYDGLDSEPRLNVVAAPDAALKGERVLFSTYSNYALQIERGEIRIFPKGATSRQAPMAVLPVDRGGAFWTAPQTVDDSVTYVLRVYDGRGNFDETAPKVLDLAAVRGGKFKPNDLASVYGGNALEVRNISVSGGSVLVSGRGVPSGNKVFVMGQYVPVDAKGDFAVKQIVPAGEHQVEVAIADAKGTASVFSRSAIIPDHDYFYVALADLTVGRNAVSGPMATLKPDQADEYKDKVYLNGRLAFYLKAKVQGSTLLTASADTRDQPVSQLFSNFDSKDPRYLLRNLDPNKYYPIYGDDSTLVEDAPTRGKFYIRLERGENNIIWGNFKTSITGTEFVRYERGLYGARAQVKTDDSTRYGERRGQVEVFAAEPGTLGGRDDYRGTGGSVYFTSRQNLTQGSERLTVETRDAVSGLVLSTRTLAVNQDYDIDYLQGRIVLRSPLASTGSSVFIVSAGALSGTEQHLVATYEYAPDLQATRDKAYGGRSSYWLNDHVQVGVTGYQQSTAGEKLAIGGADVTLRMTPGTYLKLEAARSAGTGGGEQYSIDGGFTFTQRMTTGAPAWARRVEAAADLAEIIQGAKGRLSAYWKEKDRDFSGPGELALVTGGREFGAASVAQIDQQWSTKTKVDGKQDEFRNYYAAEQNVSYSFNDYWKATLGVRTDNNQVHDASASSILNQQGRRTDVALRLDYDSQADWGTYIFGQATVNRTGDRDANNRIGVGGNKRLDANTKMLLEISEGNGGLGGKVGVEHKIDEKRTSYLNYALDPDRTDIISRGGTGILTTGSRERFSDSFSVFGEERVRYGGGFSGLTHAYGLDFVPAQHWKAGIVLETGRLYDAYQGDVKRTAVSPTIGYAHNGFTYASKFEFRHDDVTTAQSVLAGTIAQNTVRDTYMTANTITNKLNDNWRYIAKANGSYSTSSIGDFYRGNYFEGISGFAYRPVDNDRLNALFKYTYFYNQPSAGQTAIVAGVNDYSQQSHILSVDAAYDLNTYMTAGAKYGFRLGSMKDNTVSDASWNSSNAQLLIGRLDFHVNKEWDVTGELRALRVFDAKDMQAGALLAIYRNLGDNFKLGVGYNFTSFSDDMTNLSARNRGVFVNAIGKF